MPDGSVTERDIRARYEAGFPSEFNPAPPAAQSADSEIYAAGERLRDWARYLARNSAIVKAVLDARQAKGVGTGLRYEPMVRDRKGNLLTKINDAIRDIHADWSEASDVTGELSRTEIERLVWRDWDTAGEVFARQVYRGRTNSRVGYQLQLIRSELVPYGWISNGRAVMGIDRDDWGAPARYWVYPYDHLLTLGNTACQACSQNLSMPSLFCICVGKRSWTRRAV
jgi:capsid protein